MIEVPRGYNPNLENLLFNKGEFDEDLRKIVYGDQDPRSESTCNQREIYIYNLLKQIFIKTFFPLSLFFGLLCG